MSKTLKYYSNKWFQVQAGFTFVELLVVMAILAVLSAVIFSALNNYSSRQSLAGMRDDVRNGLIEAREKSMASIDDSVHGVAIGTTSINFFSGSSYVAGAPASSTIDYTTNLFATSSLSGGNTQVVFNKLTGSASATGTIVLFDAAENTYATVTVYATGLIE